jgi:hypothetical protein
VAGPVVLADVRLDLDDPADAARPVRVLADQPPAEDAVGDLEGRTREEPPTGLSWTGR